MTSKLPTSFHKHAETAKGARFCGVDVEDMDKEDLLIVIGFLKADFDDRMERKKRESSFSSFLVNKETKP